MVWLDPPGTMVDPALDYAIRYGLVPTTLDGPPRLIFDEIARTDACPRYPLLLPSRNSDPDQAEAENRITIEEAKGLCVQAEGLMTTAGKPNTDDALTDAFSLAIYQRPGRPPVDVLSLHECFRPGEAARNLLAGCTRPDIVEKFGRYHALVGTPNGEKQWDYLCGAGARRLRKLADSPQFRKRCNGDPEFWRLFFNAGGVLMLSGKSRRNLSRTDTTLVISMVLRMIFMLARDGLDKEVWVIGDEGQTTPWLDDNVAVAASEAGKWGVKLDVSLQKPQHPNKNVQESLQNFDKVYAFKHVHPEAVRFTGQFFSLATYDPMEVWFEEERIRYEDDTPETLPTETVTVGSDGKTKTVSKGFTYRARKKAVTDKVTHYKTGDAQDREVYQALTTLRPGQCLIKDGNLITTSPVQLPLLPRPWDGLWFSRHPRIPLAEEKRRKALEFMRQRAEYRVSPTTKEPTWTPPETPTALPPIPPTGPAVMLPDDGDE